jgi:hypothetical protein
LSFFDGMHSGSVHVLPLLAALLLPPLIAAQPPWQICGDTGNYSANGTYQANLNLLAAALPKNVFSSVFFVSGAISTVPGSAYSFYSENGIGTYQTNLVQLAAAFPKNDSGAAFTIPESTFALSFCRGDINASVCADCVGTIFQDARQLCPYSKEVSIACDTCYLRFSNMNFLSSTDNSGLVDLYNPGNVSGDIGRYNRVVTGLLIATAAYAADNSTNRFATGEVEGFNAQFPKIYSMAQCTSDLSSAQCRRCLDDMVGQWWQTFEPNTQGARIVGARCTMRVELYSFSGVPSMLQLPADAAALLTVPAPAPAPSKPPPLVVPGTTGGE